MSKRDYKYVEQFSAEQVEPRLIPTPKRSNKAEVEHVLLNALMACVCNIDGFLGEAFGGYLPIRVPTRARDIECRMQPYYIVDKGADSANSKNAIPDALLTVTLRSRNGDVNHWKALVEAKTRSLKDRAIRTPEIQLGRYKDIVEDCDYDALIIISTDLVLNPNQNHLDISSFDHDHKYLFHFSWDAIKTYVRSFRLDNRKLHRLDHYILKELERAISSPINKLPEFNRLSGLKEVYDGFRSVNPPTAESDEVKNLAVSWIQASRKLALWLNKKVGGRVYAKIGASKLSFGEVKNLISEEIVKKESLKCALSVSRKLKALNISIDLKKGHLVFQCDVEIEVFNKTRATNIIIFRKILDSIFLPEDKSHDHIGVTIKWESSKTPDITTIKLNDLKSDLSAVCRSHMKTRPIKLSFYYEDYIHNSFKNNKSYKEIERHLDIFYSQMLSRLIDVSIGKYASTKHFRIKC